MDDEDLSRAVWRLNWPRLSRFVLWLRSWVAPRAVCDCFFDRADKRAWLGDRDLVFSPTCPACQIATLGGREAWAVTNDCNGIFCDAIAETRAEARELAAQDPYASAGCYVVPVRVYEEPDDHYRTMREWVESQRDHEAD